MGIEEVLDGMNEAWEETESSGGFDIPDGTYEARLQGAEIVEVSSDANRLRIKIEWLILEGDVAGTVKYDSIPLHRKDGTPFLSMAKGFLEKLGAEVPQQMRDVPETLASLVQAAPRVSLKVQTKGDFQNCTVQSVLDDVDAPAPAPKAPAKAPAKAAPPAAKPTPQKAPQKAPAAAAPAKGKAPMSRKAKAESARDEGQDLADLVALCGSFGVELSNAEDLASVVADMQGLGQPFPAAETTPEEQAVLAAYEIPCE